MPGPKIWPVILFSFTLIIMISLLGPTPAAAGGYVGSGGPMDCYVEINGIKFHYLEYPAAGPDVVLIHGFASSTYTWEKTAPLLHQAGYHVRALDMKGFGWSDKPEGADYNPLTLMEEINQWMHVLGLEQVVLAGNSLGGAMGWLLALEHPDKISRLILIDAAGYPHKMPGIVRAAHLPMAAGLSKLFFSRRMVRRIFEQVYYCDDLITGEQIEAYYARMSTENAFKAQVALARSLKVDSFKRYIERIPEIKVKTLVIWGENDEWIPLENGRKFNRDLINSTLAIIPCCGHAPQEERPGAVAGIILDFLEK